MSWRGLYVQSNHILTCEGEEAVKLFAAAFDAYWDAPKSFRKSAAAEWTDMPLAEVDAQLTFSPHNESNSVLQGIADDVLAAKSSIFYSLAFLATTGGPVTEAIFRQIDSPTLFVAGISDKEAGVEVSVRSSNLGPTFVAALEENVPPPFRDEPTGLVRGVGARMHHKFIVLDFDTEDARVYLGSYNMSEAADRKNGENLFLIKDRRVATSFMIEALRMVDHYQYRVGLKKQAEGEAKELKLKKPPASDADKPWFAEDYSDARKIRDRELFARTASRRARRSTA